MKNINTIHDLAMFGAPPAFQNKLHVGRPNIGNRKNLNERLNNILDKKWLTNQGEYVQQLEKRIASYIGVKHCICICNGTIALEISIRALNLTGEVIIPSFTFIATAHALQWQGIKPVFCDIHKGGCNIDPALVEFCITPETSGIIGVHVWGAPCDYERLTAVANKHQIKLMFDAAHAFGCSYHNRKIGNHGHLEVFSFHATKVFNSFEGGAIVTNDDTLANKIRLMKNFGFSGHDNVVYIGSNGKMSEISAAMGLTNLESLDTFIQQNQIRYYHYKKLFEHIPGFKMMSLHEKQKSNFHYVTFEIDEKETGLNRDQIVNILHAENIIARRYFYPGCHRMEPYRTLYPNAGRLLPQTEHICKQVLVMPTGPSISKNDIDMIYKIVTFVVKHQHEIKLKMKNQ